MSLLTVSRYVILLFAVALLSFSAWSQESFSFNYNGEFNENFSLDKIIKETRYKEEVVNSTCYRDVPYTATECKDVVRTKVECSNQPVSKQECRLETRYRQECNLETRYRQECRPETRYRQECHTLPGRNECRQVPRQVCDNVTRYRQECHMVPGGMICEMVNGRRVCRQGPARQECRQVPYTDRVCRTVMDQQCHWVPGRQECRQVSYIENVCRQVPYSENVCRQVPYSENVCHTVTVMENVCKNVSYTENVCEQVTRHRQEAYACTKVERVPYVVEKHVRAKVRMEFENPSSEVKFKGTAKINNSGEIKFNLRDQSQRPQLIVVSNKNISQEQLGEDIEISADYMIKFIDKELFLSPIKSEIQNISLGEKVLRFSTGKIVNEESIKLYVAIKDGRRVLIDRFLSASEFEIYEGNNGSMIRMDLSDLDIGSIREKALVFISLTLDAPRELLNDEVIDTSKLTVKRRVELAVGSVIK